MLFFCASICQSLPLALGVSNVAQILCLMEYGILNAFAPICAGKLLSSCAKKAMVSLSFCTEDKSKAVNAAPGSVLIWRSAGSSPLQKQYYQWSYPGARNWDWGFAWPLQYQSTVHSYAGICLQAKQVYTHTCLHVLHQGCLWTENASNCVWGSTVHLQRWQQKTKQPGGNFFWLVKKLSKTFTMVSFSFHRSFCLWWGCKVQWSSDWSGAYA